MNLILSNILATTPGAQVPLGVHPPRRAHLVGIAGAGMRALADVLAADGWRVSGSDLNCQSVSPDRFSLHQGHAADTIDARMQLVVYSDAVPRGNVELLRARELGVEAISYPQMLGRMMEARAGAAVAGTHGKSTTTAMAAEILEVAGLDPTVICGAAAVGQSSGGRLGAGRWLLAEACEYRANFRYLKPRFGVILGIEADHFDCFGSERDLEAAFAEFAQGVAPDGLMLFRADCESTRRAVAQIRCPSESFGLTGAATWRASELRERRGLYSFRIRCHGRLVCDVKLQVAGRHNVSNAVAAAALASHCGASATSIRAGLEQFAGLERRLQVIVDSDQIAILDDYAHHPTAVAAALSTIRQMFPGRRLVCVFEPHQASRLRNLLHEFAHSLQNADKIIVSEVCRAREGAASAGEVTAAQLAARIGELGGQAEYLASHDEIEDHLKQSLRSGDVLVTVGAGEIGKVAHGLSQRLRTFRKAG